METLLLEYKKYVPKHTAYEYMMLMKSGVGVELPNGSGLWRAEGLDGCYKYGATLEEALDKVFDSDG